MRDRYNIKVYGLYANMPAASIDLKEVEYIVPSGENAGKRYYCNGAAWIEIPVAAHVHSGYLSEIPEHGNEKHDPNFLSEIPEHGSDKHSADYALNPHTHSSHWGVVARGQVGFASLADVACAGGAAFWITDFPLIEVDNTHVVITALYIKVSTAPTANVAFTVKKNAVTLGTLTLISGTTSVSLNIDDVGVSNGDTLILDAAEDTKDLKGLRFYAAIERTAFMPV